MGYEEALRLIEEAKETGATRLDLIGQGLTELPPQLFELTNLSKLFLNDNQLTSLPSQIVQLSKLKTLWLHRNLLTALPPEVVQLTSLRNFRPYGNPLSSPPFEIATQGIEAIRKYFADLEGEKKELAEVKVVLVGEGASGKTSLTRLLRNERFNKNEPMTHGIRIKPWKTAGQDREIRCKLWDFGGQEIMHATH